MKNAARVLTATLIFLSALLLGQTLPSVPSTLSYQGRLADGSLAPVPDGEYEMSFLIFSASSGGTLLWSESRHPTSNYKWGSLSIIPAWR